MPKPFKYERVRALLPELDELRPVLDALLATSKPSPGEAWTGSGEVGTEQSRLVDGTLAVQQAADLAEREAEHLRAIYALVGSALERAAAGEATQAAEAMLNAAHLEEERGRFDRACQYARSATQLAREGGEDNVVALALRRWGRFARSSGDLPTASSRYKQSYEVGRAINDVGGAAEAAIGLGNVFEEAGRWQDASRWYLIALEQLPDSSERVLPQHWQAKVNMHIALRSSGRVDESEEWLVAAGEDAQALNGNGATPFLKNAWGQLYQWRGEFGAAERAFREGLEATDDPRARVTIELNLSETLLAQGRRLEAAEHARDAEREALRGSIAARLAEVYRLLGRIATVEEHNAAFVLFERSLEICRERRLPDLERALTLQAYGESEQELGNLDTAADLFTQADEIYSEQGIDGRRHMWSDVHRARKPAQDAGHEAPSDFDQRDGDDG